MVKVTQLHLVQAAALLRDCPGYEERGLVTAVHSSDISRVAEALAAGNYGLAPSHPAEPPAAETEALTPRQKELCREWLDARLDDMFTAQDDGDQLLVRALKALYAELGRESQAEHSAAVNALRSYAELVAALEWLQAHLPHRKIGGHVSYVALAKAHGWPGLGEP